MTTSAMTTKKGPIVTVGTQSTYEDLVIIHTQSEVAANPETGEEEYSRHIFQMARDGLVLTVLVYDKSRAIIRGQIQVYDPTSSLVTLEVTAHQEWNALQGKISLALSESSTEVFDQADIKRFAEFIERRLF